MLSREKGLSFYRKQFLTIFQKTVSKQFRKQQVEFENNRLKGSKNARST